MPEWLMHWVTPGGLMMLLGGIVWGVQLNVNAMLQNKRLTRLETKLDGHAEAMAAVSKDLVKVSVLLAEQEKRINRLDK